MGAFKEPGFQDRVAAAKLQKAKALEQLRNKPPIDPSELARRAEARLEKEAAAQAKREAIKLAKAQELADKLEQDRLAAEAAVAARPRVPTAAELKAARDKRYADRKARKK
jgi:hypothetical protein